MMAQLAGGMVTAGSAGRGFSYSLSSGDRALRSIIGSMKTPILLTALALSLAANVVLWDSYRKWPGTAGFEHMGKEGTPFTFEHSWRMGHRDYSYLVDKAPSLAEAEAQCARTMVRQYGYRFPRWWQVSRMYEDISPEFRAVLEKVGAR